MRPLVLNLLIAITLALFAFAGVSESTDPSLQPTQVLHGFEVPECAVVDPDSGFIYVSNIEAVPAEYWSDNGKGFISRLNPDGTLDTLRWIDSSTDFVINSPKGMCILDSMLYVADNSRVLRFSLENGMPNGRFPVEGAERLNDMATDGVSVYVSEIAAGLILQLDLSGNNQHHTVAELESVNGITFHGERMYAVSWDLHEVYEIDRSGDKEPTPFGVAEHFTNLDGIEVLEDGAFIVSDFVGNKVSRIDSDRKTVSTIAELDTPADIGLDRKDKRLFVPQLTKDSLAIFQLP